MPSISALSRTRPENIKHILDDIEDQFHLDEAALKTITSQYLADVNLGLGEYGQAMAMMRVLFSLL